MRGLLLGMLFGLITCGVTTLAGAGAIKKSIIEYDLAYNPVKKDATADYVRIGLDSSNKKLPFDKDLIDAAATEVTITRGTDTYAATIALISPQKINPGQPVSGFINLKPDAKAKGVFMPGDMITLKLVFNGNAPVSNGGARFSDGDASDGSGVNTTVNVNKPGKVSGQSAKYDPSYTITDDLDPSLYDDTNFNVVGLTFLSNLTESQFDALSLTDIANGIFPSGSTQLATFELQSSLASSGSLPDSATFDNPWPQPLPGDYDVALGDDVDPVTGTITPFIDGYEGGPEPAAWAVMLLGLGLVGATLRRRRGAGAEASGLRA